MAAIMRILALTIKEFLSLLKDKKSRFVIIVPPLVQLLVFGYAATYDLTRVPYAIYNEDSGGAARDLLADFHGSPYFHQVAVITHQEQIAPLIDDRQALVVVHIQRQFSRDLLSGRPGRVQVIVDGRNSNTALIALGYVRDIILAFNLHWDADHHITGPPAQLVTRAWFNPNLLSRWFVVPGIVGLLTLVVTMLVTALSVAREREQGTFDQLLVTPFTPVEILLGKALPGLIIGMAEATVMITAAVWWFHVPLLGSLVTLYAGTALFVIAAIGVGLAISAISATMQQGLLGAFLFLVPAIILSGFTTPIANMPTLVQWITLADPLRYFLVILRGVFLQATPMHLLVGQMWPMAVIGVITLSAATWLFRHRSY